MNISYTDHGNSVKIICNSIICALFFSNIFPPDNLDKIMLLNKFEFNKKLYTFNKKTKKLVITNI